MLYWLFIPIAGLIISGVNILCKTAEIWYIFVAVFGSIVAVILVDALTATLVRWVLPKKWFSVNSKMFNVKKKETIFYEKIGIKKWKDKIPELGSLTGFSKGKIADPKNNEFIERFILESHYGIGVHFVGMVLGFVIIFIFPLKFWYCFGLPVAIVNLVYNLLFYKIYINLI